MSRRPTGKLRIIGGAWRSRVIEFDAEVGVRPTPDRVRQTLFDWLAPRIEGAVCLDLFAGSGALGLEALSRGAGQVNFVEIAGAQAHSIRAALSRLGSAQGAVWQDDALTHIRQTSQRYEIVFLDAPFGSDLLGQALLSLPRVLKAGNRVYYEWSAEQPPQLPPGYFVLRAKQAGRVSYGLMTYEGPETVSMGSR